ncbi:MAG: T9SS type A sorting domain-containing protein [Cyclobacteriaceae bacterium]
MKTYYSKFKRTVLTFVMMILVFSASAQNNVWELFENSYWVINSMRLPNGMYRDSKVVRQGWTDYHPISVANVGVGLISVCIADRAGFESNGQNKVTQTLETILGYTSGFNPDTNASGYYRHFLDPVTGANAWNSEYSTIDAAILVSGALFAKNYYNGNWYIGYLADQLFNSIDWSRSVYNGTTGEIYLEMGANGYGFGQATMPFNEYMIVANLARIQDVGGNGIGTQAWNTWTNLGQFDNANYWGYPLLTDDPNGNHFISDFTVQFPYYYVNWATTSVTYNNYMRNAMNADRRYYNNINNQFPDRQGHEWGLGAGSNPGGYNADAINDHPYHIVSPHIMAGYLALDNNIYNDLVTQLSQNKSDYYLSNGLEFQWRYSLDNPAWRSNDVQGVDYSTMLFGLAQYFYPGFFQSYNSYGPLINTTASNSRTANEVEESREREEKPGLVSESSIYPNPAQRQITVEYSRGQIGAFKLEIFDLAGRKFHTEYEEEQSAGLHQRKLDLNDLPRGEYIIRYMIGDKVISKKLSKTN